MSWLVRCPRRWATVVLGLALGCGSSSDDGPSGDNSIADAAVGTPDATVADAAPPPPCPGGDPPSFAVDVQPILTENCTDMACHDDVGPAGMLRLTSGNSHEELVGVTAFACSRPLVTPSEVGQSYLINKLTGNDMCSGSLMPRSGEPLSAEELDVIVGWICNGALDD